jgi:bacteriocin-like protein
MSENLNQVNRELSERELEAITGGRGRALGSARGEEKLIRRRSALADAREDSKSLFGTPERRRR